MVILKVSARMGRVSYGSPPIRCTILPKIQCSMSHSGMWHFMTKKAFIYV
jgi:hypothetical protein